MGQRIREKGKGFGRHSKRGHRGDRVEEDEGTEWNVGKRGDRSEGLAVSAEGQQRGTRGMKGKETEGKVMLGMGKT